MARRFNTTGCCNAAKHYMVDISHKIRQIEALVDDGAYFTIRRAHQFGKTTTLNALSRALSNRYSVIKISFEGWGERPFSNESEFATTIAQEITERLSTQDGGTTAVEGHGPTSFVELSRWLRELCQRSNRPLVLMIDETDKSTDNQCFLNFIGLLRSLYLEREEGGNERLTFQSVILAGVRDIKNLKVRLRSDEERRYNSPWNIATDFDVDMSFSTEEIAQMLNEYKAENDIAMDISLMAEEIFKYSSGYPYLVSRTCEIIDKRLSRDWTTNGIRMAIKEIVKGRNDTLVDDISKNLENDEALRALLFSISVNGKSISYTLADSHLRVADMYSYTKERDGRAVIHNLIFEEIFHLYFTSRMETSEARLLSVTQSDYVLNGKLQMEHVIDRFQRLMREEYRKEDDAFIERQGRLLFLCFLKPIINGTGFYYVEPQTRENSRMDLVVAYGGEEFIIELKIWRGEKYERNGKEQLAEYLSHRNIDKGYLVTFSFLKDKVPQEQPEWHEQDGKMIYEAVI